MRPTLFEPTSDYMVWTALGLAVYLSVLPILTDRPGGVASALGSLIGFLVLAAATGAALGGTQAPPEEPWHSYDGALRGL